MSAEPQDRRRVLILDDDDSNRAVMAEVLTHAGYYVAGLDHSPGVIESLKAQRPDLLLLDMLMPDMDGLQVLGQLHLLDYTLPVLVVTGLPLHAVVGAREVLQKPFDVDTLVATVERLIGPAAR